MIGNFFKEIRRRNQWGYPIGDGFRMKSITRGQLELTKDAKGFIVVVDFGDNRTIIIYDRNPPEFYSTEADEALPLSIWLMGVDTLRKLFLEKGDNVILSSQQ